MKCPFCSETIQDDAIVCRHCRSSLTADEANWARFYRRFQTLDAEGRNKELEKLSPEQRSHFEAQFRFQAPLSNQAVGAEQPSPSSDKESERTKKSTLWTMPSLLVSLALLSLVSMILVAFWESSEPNRPPPNRPENKETRQNKARVDSADSEKPKVRDPSKQTEKGSSDEEKPKARSQSRGGIIFPDAKVVSKKIKEVPPRVKAVSMKDWVSALELDASDVSCSKRNQEGTVQYWEFTPKGSARNPALMYFAVGRKPAESPQEVEFDETWTCKFYMDMDLDGRDEYLGYLHRIFWNQKSLALDLIYEQIDSGSNAMLNAPRRVIANNLGTPSPFEDYTWRKVDGKVFKLWKIYDRRAAAHAVD